MSDAEFVLLTTCPDGHPVHMRRTFDTWRVSLEQASVVLWCHECGLQWDAAAHDRARVLHAVGCNTETKEHPAA